MAHNVITVSPFERIEPMPNLIFLLASVIASIRSMLACDVGVVWCSAFLIDLIKLINLLSLHASRLFNIVLHRKL